MDSILSGIKSALSGLFGKAGDNRVVGIDIGTSSIKVVELKKEGGRVILDTYGALALGQYNPEGHIGQVTNLNVETLVKALTDVLKETNITSTNIVLGIPSISCIIFILQLPEEIEEKSLPIVIPNEAKKFIPVPIEDVSLDWYVLPRREDSGSEARVLSESGNAATMSVLVVATLNETLTKYTDVLQKTGLPMDSLEIEVFSHIRSVMARELYPVLIVDIGASKTKLTIVEHGIVETFRLVSRGSQDMTLAISRSLEVSFEQAENLKKENGLLPPPEYPHLAEPIKIQLAEIFQETNATILAYEKRYNKNIGKVIFTGGGAMTRGLLDYAKQSFATELAIADPFAKVESPVFLAGVLKNTGPEFSVALGLALKKIQ
ncbi:MAG: Type pilus assembly protein PilM, type pilus assembly protein PilM [Candidatus Nomurabacteria bacterium]|jgi:type IV pilus assembly protein PilM|nr:Type pilus assembly protein PilM, type pilus assembly protein PilM [Candidatus Nomurabacteria bacterium]